MVTKQNNTSEDRIPQGYKRTEVGVIPEDWEVKYIGEIASVSTGGTPNRSIKEYWDGDIPWITTSEIGMRSINRAEQFISKKGLNSSATKLVPPGTLLIALYGQGKTRGKIGILEIEAATNQACAGISIAKGVSRMYIFHYLDSQYERIRSMSNTGNQENLNTSLVRSIPVVLPKKESEQTAIAKALSDADAFIDSLEQLIEKKRLLKQGAMQELLTGKRRLLGFSGEWRNCQWGDLIINCSSGATPYRGKPEYYKGTVRWITSGELNYNVIYDTIEHISEEAVQKTNLRTHPAGTFLMAITGLEAAGTRGACGIVGNPATTNQSCMAIYPKRDLKTEYLYHYYVLFGNDLALQYCQGTKQQSYTAKIVKILPILLPPTIEEQSAIATVLSDMDAEITELETKLTKARQVKQGMMQELLSGKVRLV